MGSWNPIPLRTFAETTRLLVAGDRERALAFAQRHMQRLLFDFRQDCAFQGLQQNRRQYRFDSGEIVELIVTFGHEQVRVFAPPSVAESPEVVVPADRPRMANVSYSYESADFEYADDGYATYSWDLETLGEHSVWDRSHGEMDGYYDGLRITQDPPEVPIPDTILFEQWVQGSATTLANYLIEWPGGSVTGGRTLAYTADAFLEQQIYPLESSTVTGGSSLVWTGYMLDRYRTNYSANWSYVTADPTYHFIPYRKRYFDKTSTKTATAVFNWDHDYLEMVQTVNEYNEYSEFYIQVNGETRSFPDGLSWCWGYFFAGLDLADYADLPTVETTTEWDAAEGALRITTTERYVNPEVVDQWASVVLTMYYYTTNSDSTTHYCAVVQGTTHERTDDSPDLFDWIDVGGGILWNPGQGSFRLANAIVTKTTQTWGESILRPEP